VSGGQTGWQFSHNSLREFLVAERMVELLQKGDVLPDRLPVTDGMRLFVASKRADEIALLVQALVQLWPQRAERPTIGQVFCLLWEALRRHPDGDDASVDALTRIAGTSLALTDVSIERIDLSSDESSSDLENARLDRADLASVSFRGANLKGASFDEAILEGCSFTLADLSGASFRNALLIEADLRGALVRGACFEGLDAESILIVESGAQGGSLLRLEGTEASAYLRFHGAITDDVPAYSVLLHHPLFPIVEKIVTKLTEQRNRQRRGLEQRGVARGNVAFARALLAELERQKWVATPTGKGDLVTATQAGRDVFAAFLERQVMPDAIAEFLAQHAEVGA
jgi:uncharacterized protein YjbI with pentapeptide repeats